MLRRTPTTIGNPDTIMHHDNSMIQMLWMLMQSQWLSMPCLMKNKASTYAMDFASTASNLDISPVNAQRSDPQMQGTLVQDAYATIKEHLFDPTMPLIGNPTHPRDWDLKNSTSIFKCSQTKNMNSCLIWLKLTIMTKYPSRRIFEVESCKVCSSLSHIWY